MVASTDTLLFPGLKAAQASQRVRVDDDMAMLRAASELTRDLVNPDPRIYWPDMLISAALGYVAMAGAILLEPLWLAVASGIVAVLALYRAGLFIHELTHIRPQALPGFRLGWNALVGVPLLVPSFMYEGLHSLHHARTQARDVADSPADAAGRRLSALGSTRRTYSRTGNPPDGKITKWQSFRLGTRGRSAPGRPRWRRPGFHPAGS